VAITNITQAAQAVVTCSEAAFKVGDNVWVEDVTGMTQINGLFLSVEHVNAAGTSITLSCDSQLFTAYGAGGTISKLIEFEAEMVPFNPYRDRGRKCFISHVEFLMDTDSPSVTVEVAVDEKYLHLLTSIIAPTPGLASTQPREWITMTVNQEANFFTFTLNAVSGNAQLRITSIRIHCKQGGFTTQ
jgi:hypothetical protein